MKKIRTQIAEGVYLTCLPAQKFKTGLFSAQFITPIRADTAAAYALLPAILRRGTIRYPDMEQLSAELDRLYGAQISYTARKKAETQCIGFVASLVDDAFIPGGEKLLEPVLDIVGEIICAPATQSGRFIPEYVEGERSNLIDAIRGIRNNKRNYADMRLLQEMCAGEPYAVNRLGDEKIVAKLTASKLYTLYTKLLATARLELFYCGSAQPERVKGAVQRAFSTLPREEVSRLPVITEHPEKDKPRYITEEMNVTQGKLGIGFSCESDDHTALMIGNTLFGGYSNSKLFLNVREKLSLCYYASSIYHRQKNLITVSSGIELKDYQKASDEILVQMQSVKNGEVEDGELEAARSTILNAYDSIADSQGKMENFYLGQAATGRDESPEELAAEMRDIQKKRIVEAMQTVSLDTVYFLKGKETAE